MRIGFESSILSRSMTGVANYTFNIVRSALERQPDLNFEGFRSHDWRSFELTDAKNVALLQNKERTSGGRLARMRSQIVERAVRLPGARAAGVVYRVMRRRKFASSVREQSLDLFHAFNFRPLSDPGVPVLPVIYDLSMVRHPEFHPRDRVRWLEPLRETVAQAPLVHTISEFSRREIADVFGYPMAQIFVAPPAASSVFVPIGRDRTEPELGRFGVGYGEYFLIVGTHEPRKNIRTAILAYAQLPPQARARNPLILAGGRGWGDLNLPGQTEALIADGTVRFFHGIPDPQLRDLYEGARLMLLPSLYEGFGMPVVEALACGTPVAHSADTAMDEISGHLGKRVAALDVDGWTTVLQESLESNDHADASRREERIAHARRFDWGQSADLVVDAYRRIYRG